MPEGIGYTGQNSASYVDRTRSQSTPPTNTTAQTEQLESSATAREQRQREQSVQSSETLQTPAQTQEPARQQVVQPDAATISQLETANRNASLDNANGLGRTAVNSYQSLNNAEFNQQISDRVRVDIQV